MNTSLPNHIVPKGLGSPVEDQTLLPLSTDVGANPYAPTLTEHRKSLYNYFTTEDSIVTLLCHSKSTTYVRGVVNHNNALMIFP